MDNIGVQPTSSSPYDVLTYSGKRRDIVAQSSMRSSFDRWPSIATTRDSIRESCSFRYRPPPIREQIPRRQSSPSTASRASRSNSSSRRLETDSSDYVSASSLNLINPQCAFIDIEAGCGTYPEPRRVPFWRRAWAKLFRAKVEWKIRNPESCRDVGYQVRRGTSLLRFAFWLAAFFVYQLALVLLLRIFDWECIQPSFHNVDVDEEVLDSVVSWASAILAAGAAFLIGQGYFGLRATRERMERVRQTSVTLAYAFLKTTNANVECDTSGRKLSLVIYECLALLTAYPVALLHQVRGNTCEPAITKYCQQVAYNLKMLRDGETTIVRSTYAPIPVVVGSHSDPRPQVTVEYFFELFSLQLEKEFTEQHRRTAFTSMAPQHIIYNLRNHFENIVDSQQLDPGRAPIVRENIDMLALAGRECTVYARRDVIPICMLWTVDLCSRVVALATPIRRCAWIEARTSFHVAWPIFFLSIVCAIVMIILAEMWCMWDPFDRGMNTFSWTLGIASEIDNMLNEFYESATKVPVRVHKFLILGEGGSSFASSVAKRASEMDKETAV